VQCTPPCFCSPWSRRRRRSFRSPQYVSSVHRFSEPCSSLPFFSPPMLPSSSWSVPSPSYFSSCTCTPPKFPLSRHPPLPPSLLTRPFVVIRRFLSGLTSFEIVETAATPSRVAFRALSPPFSAVHPSFMSPLSSPFRLALYLPSYPLLVRFTFSFCSRFRSSFQTLLPKQIEPSFPPVFPCRHFKFCFPLANPSSTSFPCRLSLIFMSPQQRCRN